MEEEKKYLHLMLENIPDNILLIDKNGCVAFCSRNFIKLTGITDFEQIRGVHFRNVYKLFGDQEFIQKAEERFHQVVAERKTVSTTLPIDFSGTGGYRQYALTSIPMLDKAGLYDGAMIIYRDITSTASVEKVEKDERIYNIVDSTPVACIIVTKEHQIFDCNKEAMDLFGSPSKEEFSDRFFALSAPVQKDSHNNVITSHELIDEVYYTGRPLHFEWMHLSVTGKQLPTIITLIRVAWRNDYYLVGYIQDMRDNIEVEKGQREISEQSRIVEIQAQANRMASDAKTKFLTSISHEIRTPMNAIIGLSDLIRVDNLDEIQKNFFTDIKKMSKSLLQMLNDILDISKIEIGEMALAPVHFSLFELYDHICSMSRFIAESRDVEWRSSFDSALPQAVYGDNIRIRQIMVNLVNNAIKYTKDGYVDFSLKHAVYDGTEYLVIVVKDTGTGIKEDDFPKLFKTFEQLDDKTNHSTTGTGLGLSITKNLVDMMHGTISFESSYGSGSAFTVVLPLVIGDAAQVEWQSLSLRIVANDDVKVLVVDDNQINLKVALAFLANHNIYPDTAVSGYEAIVKIKKQAYDLVFMDHMMPGMDGVETTQCIRQLGMERVQTMPIIALSANAITGIREYFMSAGMNDFISKPIDANELERKLSKWLPAHKTSRVETHSSGNRTEPAPLASPESILNRQQALVNIGGDEALYAQLLDSFRQDHSTDSVKISDALNAGDYVVAHRLAHTLKSTAGFIGAFAVQRTSAEIEKVLATGIIDPTDSAVQILGKQMEALMHVLESYSEQHNAEDGMRPEPDYQKMLQLVETLEPLLETGNADSFNFLDEIHKTLWPFNEKTEQLIRRIDDFEFQSALTTLHVIKQMLTASQPAD
jgi:PAS domain S-box-containing protein